MEIFALSVLFVFSLAGFAAIFFTTFGTFIILIGAVLYTLMTGFSAVGFKTLAVLLLLYLAGEALEYVMVIAGAKKLGASNVAVAGAIIGGIAGAVTGALFFGVGIVLGTFLGIFMGAFVVELAVHRDLVRSLRAGTGGVLGRIGSIAAKVIIAIVMFYIMAVKILRGI